MGGVDKEENETVWNQEFVAVNEATVLRVEKEQHKQIRPQQGTSTVRDRHEPVRRASELEEYPSTGVVRQKCYQRHHQYSNSYQ